MLSVQNLTGGYSLQRPVIRDLTFSVFPSEWVGLIGANGAGKSTTIKHILGLLVPHSGTISIHGHTLTQQPNAYRSHISYIPEKPLFYEELTLWEHMELTAKAYGIPEDQLQQQAESLLDRFQMKRFKNWFPSTFSKGMQQKIMILCAFLTQADFLIIDEPFIGLDPFAVRSLLELLREKQKQGTGILMSTHILELAEKHCDRMILLDRGEIRLEGTMEELRKQTHLTQATLEEIFFQQTEGGNN